MKNLIAALLGVAVLGGCATTDVEPMKSGGDVRGLTEAEQRVWAEADKSDAAMQNAGMTYENAAVTKYLQEVMDRLHPEFRGTIKVRVAKDPQLNAFALPNGSIYFNLGLLARLDNEAELATVLAHEGAHFILKHGFRQRNNVKNSAAASLFVGDTLAMSSISGYSRDLEREADLVGYRRLTKVGYDTRESVKVFRHLAREAEALGDKGDFFYSSHPKLEERIEVYEDLNKSKKPGGSVGKQEYVRQIGPLRLACLESDLSMDRYKSVMLALGDKARLADYPPQARFYLAEAYLRRGDKGDEQHAFDAYHAALKAAPGFAPTYRALGIHHMKKKDYSRAEAYFARYLQLAPNAPDRDYVKNYRTLAKHGGSK
ncbi:MAG: M48 family metalloprotease [Betaproteobacteria bacterium]|nr:M48 family metalloprotease [Betaproteobacteria bacterium]